jgi:hypothetical protein
MNYSIFHIQSLLLTLYNNLKETGYIQAVYNNTDYQLNSENRKIIDTEVKKLFIFHVTCWASLVAVWGLCGLLSSMRPVS